MKARYTNSRSERTLGRVVAQGVDRVLISERRLRKRVKELGAQLSQDFAGNEIVCVGALNGVICFLADLIRETDLMTPIELVDVHRSVDEGTHRVTLDENPFREPPRFLPALGGHVGLLSSIGALFGPRPSGATEGGSPGSPRNN